MDEYKEVVKQELTNWQKQMLRNPSILNRLSKGIQTKINSWIPEKVHVVITATLKQMIRAVLFGAKYTAVKPPVVGTGHSEETGNSSEETWNSAETGNSVETGHALPLQEIEKVVLQRIEFYRTTAAVEGGITGAGGILLGLADFPILIGIKIKLLFDIASIYGFNIKDYRERIYLLHIFELAFSSDVHRKRIYLKMTNWEKKSKELPDDIHQFDWRNFQQEYRDYIDVAKMMQLVPIIGAPVGAVVNYRLIRKLGLTAMNAYRMRLDITRQMK